MHFWDILGIGFGLAMDAFTASVCKGMSLGTIPDRSRLRITMIIAGWFAAFQMGMPLIGYFAGRQFSSLVSGAASWIAFGLLLVVGGLMIRESFHPEEDTGSGDVSFRTMLPLAVATSIDALATGVSFAFLSVNIWTAVGIIGAVTFVLCAVGVLLGRAAGEKLGSRARLLGGIVLILIGVRILLESLL